MEKGKKLLKIKSTGELLPIIFNNPTGWVYLTYFYCHKLKDKEGYLTLKSLIRTHLQDIVRYNGSIGKTPDRTLCRTLQELRDLGLLTFVIPGLYKVNHSSRYVNLCREYGSKGEMLVSKILKKNNIHFEREKRFEGMKHRSYLRLDFYLPEYRIGIEYDGEQHFKEVSIWGGKEGLENTKWRDGIKDEYCRNNNIILLRFNRLSESIIEKKILKTIQI